jgi:hypothetical protein
MYHAFYEKREFTTEDICMALKELIPLAHLESDQMVRLQNWASSGRIRSASSKEIYLTLILVFDETKNFSNHCRFTLCYFYFIIN